MADINADNAANILKKLQETNGNYLTNENGINREFKKSAASSIFSQKNLYSKLNIENDSEYKDLLGGYDSNGDGILETSEAVNLAETLKNGQIKDQNKKSQLSKILSFIVGAVTAQCASMTNLRENDKNYSVFAIDTRGCLKDNNDSTNNVFKLGEQTLNSNAWDGTFNNYDYLQYNSCDPNDVKTAVTNALSDGNIAQDEINNNNALTRLFKERDLSNNGNRSSYINTSDGFNSSFYSIDTDKNSTISKEELLSFIRDKASAELKKALGLDENTIAAIQTSNNTTDNNAADTVLSPYLLSPTPLDPVEPSNDPDMDAYPYNMDSFPFNKPEVTKKNKTKNTTKKDCSDYSVNSLYKTLDLEDKGISKREFVNEIYPSIHNLSLEKARKFIKKYLKSNDE